MKLKLGIVLGMLVILAACQKEEITVTDVAQETSISKIDKELNTLIPALTDDNDGKPQAPLSPNNIYDDYEELSDDSEGYSPEVWPSNDLTDISSDLNRKERSIAITWTDESPTDEKWIFVTTQKVFSAQNTNSIGTACPFEDCDTAISAAQAYYQHFADQFCEDVYVCVTCCQRGRTLYARIIIEHNCGIMPPPEGF